jgi:hypothetical protein
MASRRREPDADALFFARHPMRYARIRRPLMVRARNAQRAVGFQDENEAEFQAIDPHDRAQRRIIVWRVPADNMYYDPEKPQLIKIPYLLYVDETLADTDEVLLPIIHALMIDEAKEQKII